MFLRLPKLRYVNEPAANVGRYFNGMTMRGLELEAWKVFVD